jgi:protease-4
MKIFKMLLKTPGIFWRFIRKFQSVVGTLLFIILMFFVISMMFGAKPKPQFNNATLMVSLNGSVSEQERMIDPQEALLANDLPHQHLIRNVIKAIKRAGTDNRIKNLILDLDGLGGIGASKTYYIGEALKEFKASGKKIYVYGEYLGKAAYLMASYADEIYLHPQGGIFIDGYSSYRFYYKEFMENIKAEVSLFRVGKFKSAMEPYIRNNMSEADKVSRKEFLGSLWNEYVDVIAKNRGFEGAGFKNALQNIDLEIVKSGGSFASFAQSQKLVDGLKSRTEWSEYVSKLAGKIGRSSDLNIINYGYYLMDKPAFKFAKEKIAVIYITGAITDGNAVIGGGDRIARHLREARKDKNVKAVILRIDSPGGSAFASEIIREEILLLKKEGITVVASMGSLAASGGYYVAADADEIWAAPTTITGSIGIFGMIPNFEGTLKEVGIHVDGVGTTDLVPVGIIKRLPEKFSKIMQLNVENGYRHFIELVANGRGMSVQEVEAVAQGRVWIGRAALENGLIDNLGTFDDALAATAKSLGLENYRLKYWRDKPEFKQELLNMLTEVSIEERAGTQMKGADFSNFKNSTRSKPQQKLLMKIYDDLKILNDFNDPQNLYLLCEECNAK